MYAAFRLSFLRELAFLRRNPWDRGLIVWGPLAVIVLLAWMFLAGVPRQLPVAVVDEDGSALSRQVLRNLAATPSLEVVSRPANLGEGYALMRAARVWAVIHIPAGAQARVLHGQGAGIGNFYNESFYSIGGAIASGVNGAVNAALSQFLLESAHKRGLPAVRLEGPGLKITPLYNPQTSYELFLEPIAVTAILHLLLACAVAAAVGREIRDGTLAEWRACGADALALLLGKLTPYVLVFCLWTLLWLGWMDGVRGWKIQGSLPCLLLGQFLLYAAYATISALVALKARELATTLSVIAIYAGSSISFADVTLPVIGAPLFTRIWSQIIPFTAYARLQMEQFVIGSPLRASLGHVLVLAIFTLLPLLLAARLLRREWQREGSA